MAWSFNHDLSPKADKFCFGRLVSAHTLHFIKTVSKNGLLKAKYEFDALGQLLVERNVAANKAWKYTYDDRGNITTRQTYTYTATGFGTLTKTDTYVYFSSQYGMWRDVLFRYDGGYNAYDALGNPTEYDNGKYFTDMTWDQGRRLTSLDYGSDTYTYSYNSSGLRTQKVVGNTTYDYYWDGSTLSAMTITVGNTVKTLKFVYDDKGVPFALNYNGSMGR